MGEDSLSSLLIAGAAMLLHLPALRILPKLLEGGENPLIAATLLPFAFALLLGLVLKWRAIPWEEMP